MESQKDNNRARFYVKLPRYIGSWLKCRYAAPCKGQRIVRLPTPAHKAAWVVYTRLTDNVTMRKLSTQCCTAAMYELDNETAPPEIKQNIPTADSKRSFVPIAIPKPHFYNGRWVADDNFMQLADKAAADFIKILSDEFWECLDEYWTSCIELASRQNKKPKFYNALLDFSERYRINMDDVDALYRVVKRRKTTNLKNNEHSEQFPM